MDRVGPAGDLRADAGTRGAPVAVHGGAHAADPAVRPGHRRGVLRRRSRRHRGRRLSVVRRTLASPETPADLGVVVAFMPGSWCSAPTTTPRSRGVSFIVSGMMTVWTR